MQDTHQKEEIQENKEVQLRYIDKLHNGLIVMGQTINRVFLALILLSFIIIALSGGIVTVNPVFSFAGLNFTLPSWLIFLRGAYLICILYIYIFRLLFQESILGDLVYIYYYSLGLKLNNKDRDDKWLHFPYISEIIMASPAGEDATNWFDKLTAIVFVSLTFLFPIIAQGFAIVRMIILFGWAWWLVVTVGLLLFIMIGTIISLIASLPKM